jgi:protoporphyrinogen oxidase
MPVKDLIQAIDSNVPAEIMRIASHLRYRDYIAVGLLLKKIKLKNQTNIKTVGNIIPDCWIYIQDRDVKIGRLQIFNNWSPYMVHDYHHSVWLGLEYFCNEGDEMWNMPKEDFIEFAIAELVKIKIIDREAVIDAHHVKIPKAYPAYFGTYNEFDKVKSYLDTIENLYCLGRNGQHKYNNMDHSMLTAFEAVKILKMGENDKSSIWNVNTEDEYHETE